MRLLLFALILFVSFLVQAKSQEKNSVWFCKVLGYVGTTPTLFVSKPWNDGYPNHYDLRESEFLGHVYKLTSGSFKPSFEPKCRDYINEKHAYKHQSLELKTAQKYNFHIKELEWSWSPNVQKTTE